MLKKKRIVWIVLLLFSGIAAFIYRQQAVHAIQAQLLKSLQGKAFVSNRTLVQDPAVAGHLIYSLKGMERIWPHRVNSLRRFGYLYSGFAGFECDIQFDTATRKLLIGHDPADVANERAPSFTDYLRTDPEHKLFWLDVKYLDSNTIGPFCDQLQRLDRQYDIRRRVVIESYDTAFAVRIGELGYLSAFNGSGLLQTDPVGRTTYITAIERLMPGKIKILSLDAGRLDFLKEGFPGRKLITWDIRFWDGMNRDLLLRYANDTSLLICLINVKSPGYR